MTLNIKHFIVTLNRHGLDIVHLHTGEILLYLSFPSIDISPRYAWKAYDNDSRLLANRSAAQQLRDQADYEYQDVLPPSTIPSWPEN